MRFLIVLLILAALLCGVEYIHANGFFLTDKTPEYKLRNRTHFANVGRAPYGIASKKFKCENFLQSIDSLDFIHIAFLYHTFGRQYDCLNSLLYDDRLMTLQVHLINEPGHRNNRLERREFLYPYSLRQYDKMLRARSAKLKRRFQRFVKPLQNLLDTNLQYQTKCLISPGLESNISNDAGKVLVKWTSELFPSCRIVWNPLVSTGNVGADYVEQHNRHPKLNSPCIYNNDGTDIHFTHRPAKAFLLKNKKHYIKEGRDLKTHIQKYAKRCEVVFLWTFEDNGFPNNNPMFKWIPPTKRPFRVGKTNKLVSKYVEWSHRQER